ncbi:MAG: DUF4282 domain-containing protein [Arachnia propionica]|uniref:DUF4282 domain-containing protein n=1 Tax=Arachnia propionica TaxID=1750 RepID=UPI0027043F08|nr:DUF4282 domain-containing protein [Arachnia propionica]
MSNQQPYDPNVSGNVWEQSQPTGNVWDQQAMEAWGTPAQQQQQAPAAPNPVAVYFRSLFDFTFGSLLTLRAVKIAYLVLLIALGVLLLTDTIGAFTIDAGTGVLRLFTSAVLFLAVATALRVALEVAVAVVRSSEEIRSQLHR